MTEDAHRAPPRVLLIGCGGFGEAYAFALQRAGMLAGVVVRRPARVAALSSELGVPVVAGLDAADALVSDVDGCAVLTPTEQHDAHARWVLDRRLPCLVIKPVTGDAGRARALHETFTAANVPLLAAHEVIANPRVRALARWLSGRGASQPPHPVGRLLRLQISRLGDDHRGTRPPRPTEADQRGANLPRLRDRLIHDATLLAAAGLAREQLTADVTDVHAAATGGRFVGTLRRARRADPAEDGPEVVLHHDATADGPPRFEVVAETTTGRWVYETRPGLARLTWARREGDGWGPAVDVRAPRGVRGGPSDQLVAHFADVIAGVAEPWSSGVDAAAALGIADLLIDAAKRRLDDQR